MTSFAARLEHGQSAELRLAGVLARGGGLVVPTGLATSNGAPVALTRHSRVVMPDLLVLGDDPRWVEVKTKATPSLRRATQRFEHGIDYAHACGYAELQDASGFPVWLAVLEDGRNNVVLLLALDDAHAFGRHAPDWPGGVASPIDRGALGWGGWLWPRDVMREVAL